MKKAIKYILFAICAITLLSVFTCAYANNLPDNETKELPPLFFNAQQYGEKDDEFIQNSFILPESLTTIEESAFEGTALTKIELPENLKSIEDNAFANIPTLRQVNIPNATIFIGKDVFKGSNQVTITAAPRSYARAYARKNRIPFDPIESFYAYDRTIQITVLSNSRAELRELISEGETTDNQKPNPTGRMAGELNADRYEGFTAFHIQGRSPPMA